MKTLLYHRARVSILNRAGVLAIVMVLAGCGGGSSSNSGNGGGGSSTVASISISPTSASVSVGATEQFTATAEDSSGNAISGVTFSWSSSSIGVATISGSGLATAVAAGSTNITATASGVTSSAATLTVVPALAVSTSSLPGGTVGVAYSAALQASGGTTPYAWSVSSGSLPGGLTLSSTGTITGTPTAAGTSSFSVKVTDSASPAATATANLSITVSAATTGGVSLMNGQYAYEVSGYDSAVAGSLTLNGTGLVTGGIEDIRAPSTSMSGSAIAISSGTYTVGSDDRGTISYKDANGNSFSFAIALGVSGGVASKGQMIESDSNPLEMTGTLTLQSSTAFSASSLSGGYAFESSGWDSTPGPDVTVGSFTASGGALSSGMFDQNDAGTVTSAVAFTGTIGTIDANGRGTVTLNTSSGTSTVDIYMITAGSAYLINATTNPGVQSGLIANQTGGPFSSASLNGDTVFESRSENGMPAPHASLGQIVFSSGGSASATIDSNDSGTVQLLQTSTATWSMPSAANGRVLFTPTGGHTAVGYLLAPDELFLTNETSGAMPDVATIEPQSTGSFTNASLSGSLFLGTLPLLSPPESGAGIAFNIESGVLSFDGTGNLTGTLDINSSGAFSPGVSDTDSYSVASDGRVTLASGSAVVWIVSPSKAYALQISQGQPSSDNPVIFTIQAP